MGRALDIATLALVGCSRHRQPFHSENPQVRVVDNWVGRGHNGYMMTEEELVIVVELQGRMVKADAELTFLMEKSAALHNTSEYNRLSGKREGVRLCLGYLNEMSRDRV